MVASWPNRPWTGETSSRLWLSDPCSDALVVEVVLGQEPWLVVRHEGRWYQLKSTRTPLVTLRGRTLRLQLTPETDATLTLGETEWTEVPAAFGLPQHLPRAWPSDDGVAWESSLGVTVMHQRGTYWQLSISSGVRLLGVTGPYLLLDEGGRLTAE